MKELSKERLLEWLDLWGNYKALFKHPVLIYREQFSSQKESRQAYRQIKHAITVFYNVILPKNKSISKPKISMALIKKWAYDLNCSMVDMPEAIETKSLFLTHLELWGNRLLKEAGLEVEE